MFIKFGFCVIVISMVVRSERLDDVNVQNEIIDTNLKRESMNYGERDINNSQSVDYYNNNYNYNGNGGYNGGSTWFDAARTALSGPAGSIVVQMAKEMISRSTGNSQVKNETFLFGDNLLFK